MSKGQRWAGSTVRSARTHWAARLPLPCALCGRPVTSDQPWVVEHLQPRGQGGHLTDRGNQWVSHRRCSDKQGGQMGARIVNSRRPAVAQRMESERARGIRGIGGPGS